MNLLLKSNNNLTLVKTISYIRFYNGGIKMEVSHDIATIRLTAGEIGELWTSYVYDSMSRCVISYFVNKCTDKDIRSVLEYDLSIISNNLERLKAIFYSVNFPIPVGFSDEDVNLNASQLYSDNFMLQYVRIKSKFEIINYTTALALSARNDVSKFFNDCISSELQLCKRADDVLLSKGLFIRSPYIPVPEKVEFVNKQSFMTGFLGDKRALHAREIGAIFMNIKTNSLGKAMLMGFRQVVTDKKVRNLMDRGKELASKHIEVFSSLLEQEDIPAPMIWDSEVFTSTEPPFSDELMMFHTVSLIGYGMGAYGLSLASTTRTDIALTYTRLMTEVGQYLDDVAKIMIENNWLESPPQAPERKELKNV
jgi:hypothetical protein